MKAIYNLKNALFAIVVSVLPQIHFAQTTSQNFIKKTVPTSAVTTEVALGYLSSSVKIESISYIDGLGRSLQDVLIKGSPIGNDIIQPYYYDKYGRQSIQLLPYVSTTSSGTYRDLAYDAQPVFYTNQTKVAKTTSPFSQMVFDGSPLNQITEKSAPDTDWQLGNGHTTKVTYSTNNDYEVLLWKMLSNGDIQPDPDFDNYFSANSLSYTKLTDPNGNYSYIYTDKEGHTVCTKQFLEMRTVGQLQIPYYLTTYLVYDDFGQLVMVIPPKAIDVMETSGNYSINSLTQDLVFKYKYDEHHRLIEKKVPGIGWSYIVYNQLNQPVLFQDANLQAQNKWSFIKYDVLGRPIISGLYASALNRASQQALFNANQTAIGESEVPLDASNPYGYSNLTLPNQLANLDILTVNYYDDYDFDNNGTADYTFNAASIPCITWPKPPPQITLACTPYTNIVTARTRGYLTGSRVKVLDVTNPVQWEVAAVFYDDNGQAIQSQSNDHMGGTDLINMVYDFVGNVIHTHQVHTLSGQSNIEIINRMYYDKMGRLTRVDQKNNNNAPVVLSKYDYNELSQVIDKKVHSLNNGTSFIQSMDYRYNIHGGLTSINNIDLAEDMTTNPLNGTNDDTGDLWGMQLNYNTNTVDAGGLTGVKGTKQYTGNVSEKKWRSVTDNIKRAYGYDYDKANRIKASTYVEYNSGASLWNNSVGKYDEKDITYDANGNIMTLKRYGCQTSGSAFGLIDNLTYQYNGNFLGSVTDISATQGYLADFKDNGSTGNNEYTYDTNGNQTANPNKKITSIIYNHLNLPTQITFVGTNKKIEYTYDAAGVRLRKKVTDGANINIRNYAGIFEYNMANTLPLEFVHTSEGRIVPTNNSGTLTFRYEYQYSDNTGNVVMAFSDMDANGIVNPSTEVIQQSHYYSFGMRMEGTNVLQIGTENKYKFSGKEFNDELGLNEYDFGARFYDPAIARWGNIDPMADAAPNWTPFRYGFNNPITVTDPTGMIESGVVDWTPQDAATTNTATPTQQLAADEQKKCPSCKVEIINGVVQVTPGGGGGAAAAVQSNPAPQNSGTSSGGVNSNGSSSNDGVGSAKNDAVIAGMEFSANLEKIASAFANSGSGSMSGKSDGALTNNNSPVGNSLKTTDKHFNGGLGVASVSAKGINTISNDYKRSLTYKISKKLKSYSINVKSGSLFQRLTKVTRAVGKFAAKAAPFGTALGVGVIGYEIGTNTWDAHTFVNAGLMITGVFATAMAAPAVVTGLLVYGVANYFFDFDTKIDKAVGRKRSFWNIFKK